MATAPGFVPRSTWQLVDESVTGRKRFYVWCCDQCSRTGCTVDSASPPSPCCCRGGK